jgi:hypothetical protein
MKRNQKAINIKISFHGHTVTLADEYDRQTTPEGVTLWVKQGGANSIKPMASPPKGTLEIYKHSRPDIVSVEWVDA